MVWGRMVKGAIRREFALVAFRPPWLRLSLQSEFRTTFDLLLSHLIGSIVFGVLILCNLRVLNLDFHSISITIFRIPPANNGEAQPMNFTQRETPRSNRGVLFERCKIKGSHAFLLLQVPEGRHNVAHRGSGGDTPVCRIKPRRVCVRTVLNFSRKSCSKEE